jgi:hypothetical protein
MKINSDGEAAHTDFARMLKIVKQGGFKGFIGLNLKVLSTQSLVSLGPKNLIEKTLRKLG